MQDFIGSVRRSLVFKPSAGGADDDGGGGFGGIVEKIGSSIRKSRIGLLSKPPLPALPPPIARSDMVRAKRKEKEDASPPVRWRKGELIGCGAFGRVYMGMNLDSGELLAIKQVSIAANSASKEKTQAHIRELEEEVNLLKNLSHPNIVRYLGTAREEESLNILLEFVPGGSISSLLGKFGSFPESVIRMYTKQLLLGLEYLHRNGIMHRDIKGANILVDNKGCIKLADFGASKKVVELATMTGAKSMKGTPYWMAPEVILQTGHSFSADIWSVGCTVIEMATGKPPWSQQYQEVAALFHIGTTKSHPPIPDHLSLEAKDFLLKCLQKEPNFRAAAAVLLQHPFVMGQYQETDPVSRASENSGKRMATPEMEFKTSTTYTRLNDVHNSVRCSTIYPDKFSRNSTLWASNNRDDDMCQMDDDLVFGSSTKFDSPLLSDDFNKSFNPMSEPNDDWPCKFDGSPEIDKSGVNSFSGQTVNKAADSTVSYCNVDNDFTFPSEPSVAEDDDDVTETKIIAFLEEKAIDLKKLQTPLYEEFYNSLNASCSPNALGTENKENVSNNLYLPPKSRSPKRVSSRRFSAAIDVAYTASASSGSQSQHLSNIGVEADQTLPQVQQSKPSEWKERMIDAQPELISPSASFSERQRRWEEELYEELERKREMMRQAGVAKTPSPKDRIVNRQKDRSRFAFPGK
ncbi:mitogen-activated protein kinase kinase kinase NPK1-like isoform X2 [Rhododendron vialii]|uniref:mitogen-activated protein kinase kinase kinase NPK1-like isoform X2 n=1 Tax=Rhododendron vialii TaxID=182163 RepID=UPI00265EA862|nr:mitogen-activated protein kinase kinase kinase NPK1-like isoform X2 [Rhododendron vialii]